MLLFIISVLLFLNFPLHETHKILKLNNEPNTFNIHLIINKMYLEKKLEKILVHTTHNCLHNDDIKLLSTNNTVMLYNMNQECKNKKVTVGDILLIYCLPNNFQAELLDKSVSCLGRKRDTRILFVWNDVYTKTTDEEQEQLEQQQLQLFEYCARKRLINVIAIYRDYEIDGHFYTFSYFPEFHLERKRLSDEACFPNRVKDLKGASIRVLPDQLEPWSMAWYDQDGNLRIGGYITKILEAFVRRVNGTLTYPVPIKPNDSLDLMRWLTMLRNDTIDIIAGTAPASIYEVGHDVPSVLQPVDWNIMLPTRTIPDSELFLYLINSIVGAILLLSLIMFSIVFALEGLIWRRLQREHDSIAYSLRFFFWIFINIVLRNVIGLSTSLKIRVTAKFITRFLYMLLFLCGIFMSTLISAVLNSYLTSPLKHPRITTFHELSLSDIKVKTSQFEYDILGEFVSADDLPRLRKIFIPINSLVELRNEHTRWDTRFGYTVLSSNWKVIERYQSYLPQPLFYVSEKMFLAKSLPMSIPIQEHSIFKEALSDMINSIHSVGLTDLWTSQAYDDMITAKLLNTTTHLKEPEEKVMDLKYLYWVWWLYGIGVSLSILVFFAELWWHKQIEKRSVDLRMRRRDRLQQEDIEDVQWLEESAL